MRSLNGLKLIALLSVCFAVIASGSLANAQEDGDDVSIGKYRVIHSKILNEDRRLLIHLPRGYEESRITYPVVYHLYGDYISAYYAEAIAIVDELGDAARAPRMIVVGIDNPDRYRDHRPLWPDGRPAGSANFLRFVAEEVIPFVEDNYKAKDYRILVGPQAGAVFCLYSLMERPDLFDAFIMDNPFTEPANSDWLMKRAEGFFSEQEPPAEFLFMTFGRIGERPIRLARIYSFAELTYEMQEKGFRLELNHLIDNDDSIQPMELKKALKTLFRDYKMPPDLEISGLADIMDYYSELSKRYGFEVDPSDIQMTFNVDSLVERGLVDEAVELLHYQLSLYPASVNAYWRLGGIKGEQGKIDEAIGFYQKCIELNPNAAPMARRQIERLEAERDKK
ncbi:MAG TPA: alpha/beta hydrolase-fold protein [Acidobacteriota bacterium]|nr:alpha/beta hydrolase-fold protein [Acidobacteriota bacterium]